MLDITSGLKAPGCAMYNEQKGISSSRCSCTASPEYVYCQGSFFDVITGKQQPAFMQLPSNLESFQLKEINPLGNYTIQITSHTTSQGTPLQKYLKKAAQLPEAQKAARDDKKTGGDKKLRKFYDHYTNKNTLIIKKDQINGEVCDHNGNCTPFDVNKNMVDPDPNIQSEQFLKDNAQCKETCCNLEATAPPKFKQCNLKTFKPVWQPENHNIFIGDTLTLQGNGRECNVDPGAGTSRRWHLFVENHFHLISFNEAVSPLGSEVPIFYQTAEAHFNGYINSLLLKNITGNLYAQRMRFAWSFKNDLHNISSHVTVFLYFPSNFSFSNIQFAQFRALVHSMIEDNGGEPAGISAIIIGIFAVVIVSGISTACRYWYVKRKQKRGFIFLPTKDTRENPDSNPELIRMMTKIITTTDQINAQNIQDQH